jgi:hypothetical protein
MSVTTPHFCAGQHSKKKNSTYLHCDHVSSLKVQGFGFRFRVLGLGFYPSLQCKEVHFPAFLPNPN